MQKARVILEPLAPYTAKLPLNRALSGTQITSPSISPKIMPWCLRILGTKSSTPLSSFLLIKPAVP